MKSENCFSKARRKSSVVELSAQNADSSLALPRKKMEKDVLAANSNNQVNLSTVGPSKEVPLITRRFTIREKIIIIEKSKELNNISAT